MIEQFQNDRSTVFSICPYEINEFKPGMYPGIYKIPACLNDTCPQRLVVGPSEHTMHVGGQKKPLRIVTPSYEIAASIVRDFLDGQLYTEENKHPGICWVQGIMSVDEFLKQKKDVYEEIKLIQRGWFVLIVQKTEDDWKKYKNSRVVSDQARFAVRALGLETPEWMNTEEVGLNYQNCPACRTKLDPGTIVCSTCRCIIDIEAHKKLTFA